MVALQGLFAVAKPRGMGSAEAVARIKRALAGAGGTRKLKVQEEQTQRRRRGDERGENEPDLFLRAQLSFPRPSSFSAAVCRLQVGHGGTLDREAEGVLVIGVGRCTRLLSTYLKCTKRYKVRLFLASALCCRT